MMLSVESAISRFRRGLTLGSLIKAALLAAAAACMLLGPLLGTGFNGSLALVAVGGLWVALTFSSAKGSRLVAASPSLIASGQFEAAERQLDEALRSFSLFRGAKLLSLHHLAALRHAQRRWQESAALSRALLGQRLGAMPGLSKSTRLMLAEALLETGDVRGAYAALAGLYHQKLSLAEAMKLLLLHLDYSARVGAWETMVPPATPAGQGLGQGQGPVPEPRMQVLLTRVNLAEIMPAADAARAQAYLALAAAKVGRPDWSDWLRRRAGLLADVPKLASERPVLKELWPQPEPDRPAAQGPTP